MQVASVIVGGISETSESKGSSAPFILRLSRHLVTLSGPSSPRDNRPVFLSPSCVGTGLATDQTFPTRRQVGFCSAGSCSLVLRGLDGHSRNPVLPLHVLSQETPPISCGAISDTLSKSENASVPFTVPNLRPRSRERQYPLRTPAVSLSVSASITVFFSALRLARCRSALADLRGFPSIS